MSIFDKPDFELMRRSGDFPRLIHWALHDKDRESSRAALAALRRDVPAVVEYLYETDCWAQAHTVGRRKMLPSRGVKLLGECVNVLVRLGRHAVGPLVAAVKAYDDYGDPNEETRLLFLLMAFDALERIGRPAVGGLRELSRDRHDDVARQARDVLAKLRDRGLIEDDDGRRGKSRRRA
jgi:hypothetical protein